MYSAFLPVLMIILLRVLIPARNRHNIFVPVVLGMLGLRVFGPLLAGHWSAGWIDAAALCWRVAFALYARQY
ncbi:hypothetical protein PTKU64_86360 [Paraburkholderia terrae]|uniref:Uncharacterized protein n=1 Tax=Paraburkholderia terrae TaxID=311230 RepID=A0ABN6JW06_9BURK|nr:hypothetical protein PTKU64_86360 [Paraburkholderia terrae]